MIRNVGTLHGKYEGITVVAENDGWTARAYVTDSSGGRVDIFECTAIHAKYNHDHLSDLCVNYRPLFVSEEG
jgi:hypothetical protein